ncbi:conserved hypothetical protein [Nostocoides japonicum T1-X7]|uniref:Uncharacterized protein n=1 Tax=Nostocoides japonicum T1-X7 TaxID=1194083 RepID=A0A077LUA1_9MICO|nr:DUF2786 domain-containing protein [Tetrasphaera japonica]CCH77348.1 conserved hypothetical protein [Tetrasphaera japonica T1-X7]
MGRNNQQRRAAKARARAKQASARPARATSRSGEGVGEEFADAAAGFGPPPRRQREPRSMHTATPRGSVDEQGRRWLRRALDDQAQGMTHRVEASCAELHSLAATEEGRRVVPTLLTTTLVDAVSESWRRGRPAELHRLLSRRLDPDAQSVVRDAMVEELARHPRSTVAPGWLAQLADLEASPWWSPDTTFVSARAAADRTGLAGVIRATVAATVALHGLPDVPVLEALPGRWRATRGRAAPVDARVLERVRALLAKAESTTFEAEADTFNAAAQSLMARHSIDAAMLAASLPGRAKDTPDARRIGIDRPYESPKALLLGAVAAANRCRTVWSKELGFVTVVGFEPDLEAVETLFTSLLLQAVRSATGAGSRRYASGQSRTRSFRSSFLTSFAYRIGERLREVTDAATASAQERSVPGQDLAVVLVERSEKVDEHVDELFPSLVHKPLTAPSDLEGWQAGRVAADAARLFGEGAISAG